jgi:hypothetical protein
MIDESRTQRKSARTVSGDPSVHYGALWSALASWRSFAEAEKINPSARLLRLTLLAPDLVEAIRRSSP